MILSVIIPAFNEEKQLPQTIEKLRVSMEESGWDEEHWELIVCDNHSTDLTGQVAKSLGATVVFEPVNHISRARNKGAETAKGQWFLFLDADSYPSTGLMADVRDVIEKREYIGCGSTFEVVDGSLFNKLRMERLNPLFRFLNLSGGAFILCEGVAFRELKGFSLDLFAYEDVDFLIRLKRYGRKKGKKFKVLHHHPIATSGRKAENNLRSIVRLILSNFIAVLLFLLYFVLPGKLIKRWGKRMLGYWYQR